ncbi:CobW family GTP-binding protein [Paenibacillus sp. GYB003]|uniref:CobW family GTP-binding protein n=1 Tax=Paenibacillus sp. GYB003 TaxID=2994392 RepID=UPI002F964257
MRIPVIVLSGFLGSGKTTLLVRMLEEAGRRAMKPGVLMNELGKRDVDGLIAAEGGNAAVQRLLDGCVCCGKKGELLAALRTLVGQKPDVIVIELTGVANPEEIADALTEPELLRAVRLMRIVTVLDAEHVLEYNSVFASDRQLVRTLRRQIEVADRLVLNKTDLVPAARLAKIEKAIRKLNERAPIVQTTHSRIDLSELFAGIGENADAGAQAHAHPNEKTHVYESGSASTIPGAGAGPGPSRPAVSRASYGSVKVAVGGAAPRAAKPQPAASFSRVKSVALPWKAGGKSTAARAERFLRAWKDRLLRAKGYVRFDGDGCMRLMQYAGGRTYWEKTGYDGETYIVFIGIDLDEAELADQWGRLYD